LPDFFKPIMWSYNFDLLDIKNDSQRIIVNTINYGQWKHWEELVKIYGLKTIKEILQNLPTTEFRPSALKLASLIFNVSDFKYASRNLA